MLTPLQILKTRLYIDFQIHINGLNFVPSFSEENTLSGMRRMFLAKRN